MDDFWGFKDSRDLRKKVADMPDIILKQQVTLLSDKTESEIYGKITNFKINDEDKDDIGFELASVFDIVVPRLDNYSTTVLIMYSHPEESYPISITVGNSYIDDLEVFKPRYNCKSKGEFESVLKDILSSEEVINKIKILFSKATIL